MRRVVITGIGLLTALGEGVDATWDALVEGKSAVGPIEGYDASSLRTRIAAELDGFTPEDWANRKSLRSMTRNDVLSVAGATLAVRDAGLELAEGEDEKAALFVGSNKEISNPMHILEASLVARNEDGSVDIRRLGEQAGSAFYPLFYVEGLQAASIFYVSQAFNLKGANAYFAGTADAGLTAIGRGFRSVRRGEADVAVAGGFDDASSWWNMSKLDTLGILTQRNDLAERACRPYDRDRTGTVLGEGAAFFVLEDGERAQKRGAKVYAEVTGFGGGYDTYRLITPQPEGRGLQIAIEKALREAGSSPDSVQYAATHGSGTRVGDASEARALRAVFGQENGLAASSVKPATGHLIGGAGALNAAVAALAIARGVAPPTLNLEDPDPDCELGWVTGSARELDVKEALALARGLEGQNVAVALRAAS
jgi:3-oxoacyl-[acyl-carrier-protein] synthase II